MNLERIGIGGQNTQEIDRTMFGVLSDKNQLDKGPINLVLCEGCERKMKYSPNYRLAYILVEEKQNNCGKKLL